jgi:hypothetical protein
MEAVASKLPQMRHEKPPPVVVDECPRIINYALMFAKNDGLAKQRVLARPKIYAIAAYLAKNICAHKQIA